MVVEKGIGKSDVESHRGRGGGRGKKLGEREIDPSFHSIEV